VRWLIALTLVAAGLLVAACGDSTSSTPSPEVIETAESVARTVSFDAPISTTPQSGDEDDEPIVLDGRVFGSGQTGVILSHMRPADQTSWFPFATELADTGRFTVLTFDFRGYGDSTGDKAFDRIDTDLDAAYEFMRDSLGIEKIFFVGSSMGGTASLIAGARLDIAGVVSISSPAQFPPLDAEETVGDIRAPKLFIVSEDDVPQARAQAEFWELAKEPKQQQIYPGDAHGNALFDGDHAADLKQRIISFLESN
jgi:pimeloyl-ACP methyl ester carboxylesterase